MSQSDGNSGDDSDSESGDDRDSDLVRLSWPDHFGLIELNFIPIIKLMQWLE